MITASVPTSIPEFDLSTCTGTVSSIPPDPSSDGKEFAIQMQALLDETYDGRGLPPTSIATAGAIETLSSEPCAGAVECLVFKQRELLLGVRDSTLPSDEARHSPSPERSILPQVDFPLADAFGTPLVETLVDQVAQSNPGVNRPRAASGKASDDQVPDAASSSIDGLLLAIPHGLSENVPAECSQGVSVTTGLQLNSIDLALTKSSNTVRWTAGAAAGAALQGVGSTSRMPTLTSDPTTPLPTSAPKTDSSLAFAARLTDSSIPSPVRLGLIGDAVAAKTFDPAEVVGRAVGSESPSNSTGQDSDRQHQDLWRAAAEPLPTPSDDDLARAQSGADEARQHHSDLSGVISPSSQRGDAAPAPQRSAAAVRPYASFEAVNDLEQPGPAQPLRDITIRVAANTSQSADVRMLERNGQIQVTVRASDPALNSALRSNVNSLVNSLSLEGTSAEVWHPGLPARSGANTDSRPGESGDPSSLYQRADQRFQHSSDQGSGREGREKPEWLEEFE